MISAMLAATISALLVGLYSAPSIPPVRMSVSKYGELEGHTEWVRCLACRDDDEVIITGGFDHTIRFWSIDDPKRSDSIEPSSKPINSLSIEPSGERLAFGTRMAGTAKGQIAIVSMKNRERILSWESGRGYITFLTFGSDGSLLISGDNEGKLTAWNSSTGKKVGEVGGMKGNIRYIACLSNDRIIACSSGGLAKVFAGDSFKEEQSFEISGMVEGAALSPDRKRLAVGFHGYDVHGGGGITLFDLTSGKKVASREVHKYGAASVAFSSDGKTIASGGWAPKENKGEISLWSSDLSENVLSFLALDSGVSRLSFWKENKYLICGGNCRSVAVWALTPEKR
jgi:WD40 repeat protein